jgi:hypothetical protein
MGGVLLSVPPLAIIRKVRLLPRERRNEGNNLPNTWHTAQIKYLLTRPRKRRTCDNFIASYSKQTDFLSQNHSLKPDSSSSSHDFLLGFKNLKIKIFRH